MIPIGNIDRAILEYLGIVVGENLGLSCVLRKEALSVNEAYDPSRQQYYSTQLLEQLIRFGGDQEAKVLGVADVDLFIPILTFVFGEAQLGKRAAVMSVHRLRQEFYGLPGNESLFYQRCEKEAVHELGHTFGLVHCRNFECVMHYSNSIEQVDLKSNAFCDTCASPIERLIVASHHAPLGLETVPTLLLGL
jgi:archaemetzincin